MSCEISVFYPGMEEDAKVLEILEAERPFGVISFGSDATACFGRAPGMGGFVLEPWEAEEYGILPRHCALVWAGGKFRLDFDQRAGVYLNGSSECAREFCNPFEGRTEFTMRLGHADSLTDGSRNYLAPVFRVRRTDLKAKKRSLLDRLTIRNRWIRRAVYLVYKYGRPAVLLAGVLGFSALAAQQVMQGNRLSTALVRGPVAETVSKALAPSVASVGILCEPESKSDAIPKPESLFDAKGTAWLFRDAKGSKWLVTNAHVAGQLNLSVCPNVDAGARPRVAAYFPGDADAGISPERIVFELQQSGTGSSGKHIFKPHPLYSDFNNFDPPQPRTGENDDVESGHPDQEAAGKPPAGANVYDLAVVRLDETPLAAQLGNKRIYLQLALDPDPDSELPIGANTFEPGRPVLAMGYPTANMPFLAGGVSSRPFEFRSAIQSRSNAFLRELPGRSDTDTPALYSFSGKSAGGMSGSPVVAVNAKDEPLLVGVVFAGTFVATRTGDSPAEEEHPALASAAEAGRTPIGDGTYAVDAITLAKASEWPATPDEDAWRKAEPRWKKWADWSVPADEATGSFTRDLNSKQDTRAASGPDRHLGCTWTLKYSLDRKLPDKDNGRRRGELRDKIAWTLKAEVPTLITARLPENSRNELAQLSLALADRPKAHQQDNYGIGEATYYWAGGTIPMDVTIAATGPYRDGIMIEIAELYPEPKPCPEAADPSEKVTPID